MGVFTDDRMHVGTVDGVEAAVAAHRPADFSNAEPVLQSMNLGVNEGIVCIASKSSGLRAISSSSSPGPTR
jgi:hypothetical protein